MLLCQPSKERSNQTIMALMKLILFALSPFICIGNVLAIIVSWWVTVCFAFGWRSKISCCDCFCWTKSNTVSNQRKPHPQTSEWSHQELLLLFSLERLEIKASPSRRFVGTISKGWVGISFPCTPLTDCTSEQLQQEIDGSLLWDKEACRSFRVSGNKLYRHGHSVIALSLWQLHGDEW